MKQFTSTLKTVLLVTPILGLSLVAQEAWAGSQVFDVPDTCTTINCNSLPLNGTIQRGQLGALNPFILQIYSVGAECVRVEVVKSFGAPDLEIVLVGPDSTVWRDDDGGTDLLPLVKAITPSGSRGPGWYTLQVSQFGGSGSSTDFSLRYGRYNLTNVNCASPTPTAAAAGVLRKSSTGGTSEPVLPGLPSSPY